MHGTRVRVAGAVLGYLAILALPEMVLTLTPLPVHPSWMQDRTLGLVLEGPWIAAMVLVMVRQPSSDLWKLLLWWTGVGSLLVIGYIPLEPYWVIETIRYLIGDLWAAVFIHLVVVYPSGRFQGGFDRRFVVFAYLFAVAIKVAFLVIAPEDCWPVCGNPIAFFPSEAAWRQLQLLTIVAIVVLMATAIGILVRHWRAAGPAGRRAIAPMLAAAPLWCAIVFAGYFADMFLDEAAQDATHSFNALGVVQGLTIPGAIIIGAFRTSLARGNVASLAVELGRGVPVGSLESVLARTIRDPSLRLAFPSPGGEGMVDAAGQPLAAHDPRTRSVTPIERDGEVLAYLIHDPAVLLEDPGLVEAVGSVARMALENERLSAQVRAQLEEVRDSRGRILEAGDAERRRVERALHDGAQQRLVALAMRLQTASTLIPEATVLLDAATIELQTAVAEVRDLSRGLHPTILTELGLAAAVDALAERTPIPISVDIPDRRFSTGVEATAYYVVAEALTNVARYADAHEASVTAVVVGDRLVTTIRDDGVGGADPSRGSGLRGLADRAAAARGQLEVTSPVGRGTVVRLALPLT